MKVNYLHEFNQKTKEEFSEIQNRFKNEININSTIDINNIKVIAGVDIAYWEQEDETHGACSIVMIDYKTKEVLETVEAHGVIEAPYMPGYLAFRELPLILEAVEKITIEPDVFMFDGNGYLHPNNMGIACHASLFLNKPTLGVAKTYFQIQNTKFIEPEKEAGAYKDIVIDGKVYGRALRSRKNVKPIFVSCGNNLIIDDCCTITLNLISKESRVPIPTRIADLETHILRKRYEYEYLKDTFTEVIKDCCYNVVLAITNKGEIYGYDKVHQTKDGRYAITCPVCYEEAYLNEYEEKNYLEYVSKKLYEFLDGKKVNSGELVSMIKAQEEDECEEVKEFAGRIIDLIVSHSW